MSIDIFSPRAFEHSPSWSVVYEWEDVIADCLHWEISPLYKTGKFGRKLRGGVRRTNICYDHFPAYNKGKWHLTWVMNAKDYRLYTRHGIIPIFLDFHSDMVQVIAEVTKCLPVYWVTSYHIYELLKEVRSNNVQYMPVSISDKYIQNVVPKKTVDVIQFGRLNPILHKFMLDYCSRNPNVEYVYHTYDGSMEYVSTKRGIIGRFEKREEYMKLLSSCKVSLVSTPGMDKGPNNVRDFGTNDFVTPRFFESAVFYSHMIGRYSDIKETEMLKIPSVCCNVRLQEEFDNELDKALNTDCAVNLERYKQYLTENVTSVRAESIKEVCDRYLD